MTTGAASAPKQRLFPTLAAWWLAAAVLPGFALQGSQTPRSGQPSTQVRARSAADDFYEQEVMNWKAGLTLFMDCQKSVDAHTLAILNRSLHRWQGKTIAIVGDSLTHHVYESLACSGALSGAQLPLNAHHWPPNLTSGFDKLPLNKTTTSNPTRFNRMVFEEEWENAVTLEQYFFYDYPKPDQAPGELAKFNKFWDSIFDRHADILFVNFAHQAFSNSMEFSESVLRELIRGAEYCGVLRKLVLLGHSPQHFDTPSGAYSWKAQQKGGCYCHGQEDMQLQPVWNTNRIMAKVAREFNIPYVDPWKHYFHACKDHRDENDCTHFLPDLSLHVGFVEEMLRAGEHAIGIRL